MEKNKFKIKRHLGWKGLTHSDLGFPHVGHTLQMGQIGLLQSASPCKTILTRLIICLNISAGVIFMWFLMHYSISGLSVFSLCEYFNEVWDNCIHFCIWNSTGTCEFQDCHWYSLYLPFCKFKIWTLFVFLDLMFF